MAYTVRYKHIVSRLLIVRNERHWIKEWFFENASDAYLYAHKLNHKGYTVKTTKEIYNGIHS